MRVAVVTQYFPTSRQPWAGHSAYQTLRLLAKSCDLKVFYPEAVYPAALAPRTWVGPLDRSWRPPDVDVEYIPYATLPVISRPLNGFTMERKLHKHLSSFAPDIILSYVVYPDGYAAIRLGASLRKPVVLTAIGSDLNRISDPLCGVLTRSALRQADATITVSANLAEVAVRLGSARNKVFPILNGCDTNIFHPQNRSRAREELGLETDIRAVVYVGRLDIRKGLLELVDAFAALSREASDARLFLIGDGSDKPLIEERIQSTTAASRIQLVPPCPTREIARWMAASDVMTLPSYNEGCPNVVIEALCSGRPVVATHVGGIPELMSEDSGRLVPARDSTALSRALREVLSEEWDAEEIADRHRRTWQDVADDVFDLLQVTKSSARRT